MEVRQSEPSGLESIANIIRPLLSPLTTTALAILFLMFILLQREDIRDRSLRLAGTADLQRSTAALDDAAARLSRFFLMQTILNAGFGVVIGTALWLIGVPNAVLWGILAGLMRFVPFVGSIIAACFPIALAAAVDPGWTMVLATAALFIVAEPLAGHVIEPVLFGQSTGLDEAAATMLTQLLEKHGLAATVQPFTDVASVKTFKIDALDAPLVCLSYFGAVANPAHVRYLIPRLKRLMPHAKFLAGYWMLGEDRGKGEDWRTAVGAHFMATSLTDAVAICVREAREADRDLAPRKIHALPAALPVSQLVAG